jgi:hypothetical protein
MHAQPACNNTPAYSTCEIAFDLSDKDAAAHADPFRSVDLRVEFRSPRRRTYAIPAFWDGGRRLLVRVAPTEAGQWDYHVTSNIAEWNDKTGSFTAAASESPGFIQPANVHHWQYTEKTAAGLSQAHLWMGAAEPLFAAMDDAAFRAMADARAAQKFTHVRGMVLAGSFGSQFANGTPNLDYFRRLDARVRYLNQKGLIADLVLAGGAGTLTKLFPTPADRRAFVRFIAGRYDAMNVTWEAVDQFDEYPDGRGLLKEVGGLLKEFDPYQHPRTTGARITSTPLLDDGWQTFATHNTPDDNVNAVEHQLYGVPFVATNFGREDTAAPADFRKRLWNATMDGQYLTYTGPGQGPLDTPGTKAMKAWYDLMADTRYWELEPYFDVDGGRAVALEHIEYVVYIERPGPIELQVEKHSYDVFWMNPADGETIQMKKKFSGDHFTGEPPDRSHDWVLHVVREGRVAGMNRSFKFESRDIVLQDVETSAAKVPFAIEQPSGDVSISKPAPFSAKITRETRATRSMLWLWMGDVAADHQGYRVVATGQKGMLRIPPDIATHFPALMHLRLYGMNANGKVYEADAGIQINP